MIHGIVEEEDEVEVETIDIVEVVEVAGEEMIVTIVEAVDIRGDDGTLDVVDIVEIADEEEIVKAGDEVVAGDVEHTEDVVGHDIADVIVDEGVAALADEKLADVVERKPRDVVDISNPFGEVELGDVKMDLGAVVVGNALVEQEDDGVDSECAEVGDDSMVDAVVRAPVKSRWPCPSCACSRRHS